jgi:hypothetical protein
MGDGGGCGTDIYLSIHNYGGALGGDLVEVQKSEGGVDYNVKRGIFQ